MKKAIHLGLKLLEHITLLTIKLVMMVIVMLIHMIIVDVEFLSILLIFSKYLKHLQREGSLLMNLLWITLNHKC